MKSTAQSELIETMNREASDFRKQCKKTQIEQIKRIEEKDHRKGQRSTERKAGRRG